MNRGLFSLLLLLPALGTLPAESGDPHRAFLDAYCVKCHSGEKPKGDWRVEDVGLDFADKSTRERWQSVMEKLEAGEMPPKSKPRPPETEVRTLTGWINTQLEDRRAAEGRVMLRRLNRAEYANTVRDLLGVDVDRSEE